MFCKKFNIFVTFLLTIEYMFDIIASQDRSNKHLIYLTMTIVQPKQNLTNETTAHKNDGKEVNVKRI